MYIFSLRCFTEQFSKLVIIKYTTFNNNITQRSDSFFFDYFKIHGYINIILKFKALRKYCQTPELYI